MGFSSSSGSGGSTAGPTVTTATLTSTQPNSTVTPAVLTGHTWTIPPGKKLQLVGQLIFTAAATTTGAAYGVKVTQPSGASGNAIGSGAVQAAISSAPLSTGLLDGDVFAVAAGASATVETVGTATAAGNNCALLQATICNLAAAHSTTVEVVFRSEVAASDVTAQIGTGCTGIIS